MENVLKTIARQANLDRILFTPGLKKLYFEMSVASGGSTILKHAESVRQGLSFVADKADDKKHALLFCSVQELHQTYDQLLKIASDMIPAVVLAVRESATAGGENWSFQSLRDIGWIQFHTHTLQEAYDHLVMAYYLFEEKHIRLPILILHSGLSHSDLGTFTVKEDINLGNPLTGLQTSRVGKRVDFDAALAAVKQKKEKPPTLAGSYKKLPATLRESYTDLGYTVPPVGLPYRGQIGEGDTAMISLIPHSNESENPETPFRFLCYRPFVPTDLIQEVKHKKNIVVIESKPTPGNAFPPFFAEILCALGADFSGRLISICTTPLYGTLGNREMHTIERLLDEALENPDPAPVFYNLDG